MLAKIISYALIGIEGYPIAVEVDLSNGLPAFDLVGLPDSAVKESRERVRTAIKNSGFAFPSSRITVNLAPADTRKEGPAFDLPIAAGVLSCMGEFPPERAEGFLMVGELSLDGGVRAVNGVLSMVHSAFAHGIHRCLVPAENAPEAALVPGMNVYPIHHLKELIDFLAAREDIPCFSLTNGDFLQEEDASLPDFSDIKGQQIAKRVMEIAAAGMHNILLIGPPGSGKTMLAKRLPSILPGLTFDESIEITKLYSVAGLLREKRSLCRTRPFRAPHHTISAAALTGGGRIPRPGEISLAHNGVLFLDELPEFQRTALEILRQPLEDGAVTIARVNGTLTYPADFMLVAAMNPCPCGYLGDDERCRCTPNEIARYQSKISGPLLDRIDLMAEMPAIPYQALTEAQAGESSARIKERVLRAKRIQQERYRTVGIRSNAQLTAPMIEQYCPLGAEEKALLALAFDRMQLSARAYHKLLKAARTIADLEESPNITRQHLAEVLQYRSLDRKYRP